MVSDVFGRKKISAEQPKQKSNYALVAISFGVFALYCVALPTLGFRIATLLFVGGTNALMDPPGDAKGWGRVALIAVVTAAATWLVFERWLSVLLPRGGWTGF